MKSKYPIFAVLLLILSSTYSQEYYKVVDKDGYANLRLDPNQKAQILDKVGDKSCVIGLYTKDDWIKVLVFSLKKRTLCAGFIHNSRLLKDNSCRNDSCIKSIPDGDVALESLDQTKGFESANVWYKKFKKYRMDDGYYSESYSDYVMVTLAKSFSENISALSQLKHNNPEFVEFVIRHIDPTGAIDDLAKIITNESKCKEKRNSEICNEIISQAKEALRVAEEALK